MPRNISVAIADYRTGNTHSVERSLKRCGIVPIITADPDEIFSSDGLILPGVGAFGPAMETLMETGGAQAIRRFVGSGKPILAICLGMQLLADESEEGGHHRGLGIVSGRVRRLHQHGAYDVHPKVPQIAWNEIQPSDSTADWDNTVLANLESEQMYFVHSYVVEPSRSEDRLAETDYAGDRFCSAFQVGNVFGVQFHPELSADAGQSLFGNFAKLLGTNSSE